MIPLNSVGERLGCFKLFFSFVLFVLVLNYLSVASAQIVSGSKSYSAHLLGSTSVSDLGGARYQIPLVELSSTADISLSVGLSYDSLQGNGILGMGFSLTGLSQIKVCEDEVPLSASDLSIRYCLDGQLLHRVETRQPAAYPDYFSSTEYAAIGAPNNRIWYHNDCEVIGFKNGNSCWVVENSNQEFYIYQQLTATHVTDYYLIGVTDRFGRTPIHIDWRIADVCFDQGVASGSVLMNSLPVGPERIYWGGPTTGQEAWFEYECFRPDPFVKEYNQGSEEVFYGTMPETLKGVVFTDHSVPDGEVKYAWATRLGYHYAPVTERSRLDSIRQCAYVADGLGDSIRNLWLSDPASAVDCKIVTSFAWQDAQFGYDSGVKITMPDLNDMCRGPFFADFNRNGLPDMAYATDCSEDSLMQVRFKSSGTGFSIPYDVNVPADADGIQLFDKDGDGQMGFVSSSDDILVFYDDYNDGEFAVIEQDLFDDASLYAFYAGDFNGDGLSDIVTCQSSNREVIDWRNDAAHHIDIQKEFVYYRNTGNTGGVGFQVSLRDLNDDAGIEQSGIRCLPGQVKVYNDTNGKARLTIEALKFLGTESSGYNYEDRSGSGSLYVSDFSTLKVKIADITVPLGGGLTAQEVLLRELSLPRFRHVDLYGNGSGVNIGPSGCDPLVQLCADNRYGNTSLVLSNTLSGRPNNAIPLLGSPEALAAMSVGDMNMNGRADLIFPFAGNLPNQCDLLQDWECPCEQSGPFSSQTCVTDDIASFYWAEYEPELASWHIQALPDQEVIIFSDSGNHRILPKFRQDFNGDGLEDLLSPGANNKWRIFYHLPTRFAGVDVAGPADVIKKIFHGNGMVDEFGYANLTPSIDSGSSLYYDPAYDSGACVYPAFCLTTGGFRVVSSGHYAATDGAGSAAFINYHYSRLSYDSFAGVSLGFNERKLSQFDWVTDGFSEHIFRYGNSVHFYDMNALEPHINSVVPSGVRGFPFAHNLTEKWSSVLDTVSDIKYVDYSFYDYQLGASHRGWWPNHLVYKDQMLKRSWEFPATVAVDLSAPWMVATSNSKYMLTQTEGTYEVNDYGQQSVVDETVYEQQRDERTRHISRYFYLDTAFDPSVDLPTSDGHIWPDTINVVQITPPLDRTEQTIIGSDGSRNHWVVSQAYDKKLNTDVNWGGEDLGSSDSFKYGYYRLARVDSYSPDDPDTSLSIVIDEHANCPLLAGSMSISGSGLYTPRLTQFDYDRCKHTSSISQPGYSHVEYDMYWPLEQVVTIRDDFGRESTVQIDVWGRPGHWQSKENNGVLSGFWSTRHYSRTVPGTWLDPTGLHIIDADATGKLTEVKYNARNQPFYVSSSGLIDRVWYELNYDTRGRLMSHSVPAKLGQLPVLERTFNYDARDRVIQSDFDGHSIYNTYDGFSKTTYNQAGHPTTKSYDALGRMRVLTDALGTSFYYDYSSSGLKLIRKNCQASCAETNKISINTNPKGQMTYRNEVGGSGVSERFYNALGEVIGTFDETQLYSKIYRDGLGRVTQVSSMFGDDQFTYEFYHGAVGSQQAPPGALLKSVSSSGVERNYQYDSLTGRLSGETLKVDDELFYTGYRYDDLGRLDELHYPVKVPQSGGIPTAPVQLKQHYAATGRMVQLDQINPVTGVLSMLWRLEDENAHASPTLVEYGNHLHTVSNHYPSGRLQSRQTGLSEFATIDVIQDLSLSYWPTGSVKERNHLLHYAPQPESLINSYEYDELNRLTDEQREVWESDPTGNLNLTHEFTEHLVYDIFGNIEHIPGTGSFSSTAAGQMLTFAGLPAAQVYDAKGRLILDDDRAISWNQHDKPHSITSDDEYHELTYDASGSRVKKTSDLAGVLSDHLYVDSFYERHSSSDVIHHSFNIYAPGGQIGVIKYSGALPDFDVPGAVDAGLIHYFHTDDQGTPNAISDESGQLVSARYYSAWGEELESHSYGADLFGLTGYTGHAAVPETGLQYMKGRHYNKRYRRFISADPYVVSGMSAGYNRYSYVYNNPATLTDPSGYFAHNPGDDGMEGVSDSGYCSEDALGCGWPETDPVGDSAIFLIDGSNSHDLSTTNVVFIQDPVGNEQREEKPIPLRANRQYENGGVAPGATKCYVLDSFYDSESYGVLSTPVNRNSNRYFEGKISPPTDTSGLMALNPAFPVIAVAGYYGRKLLGFVQGVKYLRNKAETPPKLPSETPTLQPTRKPPTTPPAESPPSIPPPSQIPTPPPANVNVSHAIGLSVEGNAVNSSLYVQNVLSFPDGEPLLQLTSRKTEGVLNKTFNKDLGYTHDEYMRGIQIMMNFFTMRF